MKNLIFILVNILIYFLPLHATMSKTTHIEDVAQGITDDTLVLFNIAEVLMDTEISLGTQAWRKYVRSRVDSQLHDELTLYVFTKVPPQAAESKTAEVVNKMQKEGIPVLAFTSRGRHEWYSSQVEGIDLLTEQLLRQIGIDFSQTILPDSLADLNSSFGDFYHDGIIYATNAFEKGEVLSQLLTLTNYRPAQIIFVDDKGDSLKTVEKALEELNIPFIGYAYSHTAQKHAQFDPMITHIQFDWLISYGKILSDEEAHAIKVEHYSQMDPEAYFIQLIDKWKVIKETLH